MASINFAVGRTKFVFEGTTPIDLNAFDSFIISIREHNEEGDYPNIPAKSIWVSYFPGLQSALNGINKFTPGRTYEVDAKIPFTLEY
jgi:hypothetical protein